MTPDVRRDHGSHERPGDCLMPRPLLLAAPLALLLTACGDTTHDTVPNTWPDVGMVLAWLVGIALILWAAGR